MKTDKEDISESLTSEEIRQVREMLKKAGQREKETVTSSKDSFLEWIATIDVLWSFVEKIKSLPWDQITSYFIDFFR